MATDNVAHTRVTSEQVGAKSTYGVVLYDASGNVISSFGGGTQYTDGDVDSTVTGTAAMGKDPSNVLYALQLDASKNLKVASTNVNPLTVVALQVTASGDTVLLASGTRKLYRVKMSNSSPTAAVTAGIKVPSINGGGTFDKTYLPALGGLGVWTFPGGYLQTTSEAISINLSGAGQVEVTAYYV